MSTVKQISYWNVTPNTLVKLLSSAKQPAGQRDYVSMPPEHLFNEGDEFFTPATAFSGYGLTGTRISDGKQLYVQNSAALFQVLEHTPASLALLKKSLSLGNGNSHVTVGADPECFIVDDHDVVIPAFNFLPAKIVATPGGISAPISQVFYDGFQGEFTTQPRTCHMEVVRDFANQLHLMLLTALGKYPKAKLTHKCVVDIPFKMMQSVPAERTELGCSPSLNVYADEQRLVVDDPKNLSIRFAGMHIHHGQTGITDDIIKQKIAFIDSFLGPIMTSLLDGLEDHRRREFYGRAGEYRRTKYGYEYRVPSSTCLIHPVVTHLILDMCRFGAYLHHMKQSQLWEVPGGSDQTRQIINTLDVDEARKVLKHNEDILKRAIWSCYHNTPTVEPKVFEQIMKGINNVVKLPSMEDGWKISAKGNTFSLDMKHAHYVQRLATASI